MKINVYFEKNRGSYWVLSNGSPLFQSQLFETRPKAIDDLEQFVTLMESPVFIESVDIANTDNSPLAFFVIKQNESRFYWELYISINNQISKITDSLDKDFDSLELAKQKAMFFCNSISNAKIFDDRNFLISGTWFSQAFADAHHIVDNHPSSKWYK